MCLRFVFLLIMRLAAWLRLSRREETWKTAEISILHHQLTVLQRRQPRRPKLNWADRALLAALDGCREAIDTGTERLGQALLDNVALSLGGVSGRHAGAGQPPRTPANASAGVTPSSMTAARRPGPEPDRGGQPGG